MDRREVSTQKKFAEGQGLSLTNSMLVNSVVTLRLCAQRTRLSADPQDLGWSFGSEMAAEQHLVHGVGTFWGPKPSPSFPPRPIPTRNYHYLRTPNVSLAQ